MATETAVNTSTISEGKAFEERWEKLRTHQRIVSRVKFQVEWEEGAERQQANGVTVDISKSGCLAVIGAGLPYASACVSSIPSAGARRKRKLFGVITKRGTSVLS